MPVAEYASVSAQRGGEGEKQGQSIEGHVRNLDFTLRSMARVKVREKFRDWKF